VRDMLSPRFLRAAVGGALGFATLVAVVLTAGGGPRTPLLILGAFWAVLGIVTAIFNAIDTVPESIARLFMNVGLGEAGFSDVDAMVARGHHEAAAETCRLRAQRPAHRVAATLRLAEILAGPLGRPAEARSALEGLRTRGRLRPADETRVRNALALLGTTQVRGADFNPE